MGRVIGGDSQRHRLQANLISSPQYPGALLSWVGDPTPAAEGRGEGWLLTLLCPPPVNSQHPQQPSPFFFQMLRSSSFRKTDFHPSEARVGTWACLILQERKREGEEG